jgi:hypothetical protein
MAALGFPLCSLPSLSPSQANILAARAVTNIMKSSLGPMGMDKMLVRDGDGDAMCAFERAQWSAR